ncbi:MAG: hypothetical protein ACFFEU_12325 [Candidatus Thorarchaeota archaeon]|jgi:hypothetical protein
MPDEDFDSEDEYDEFEDEEDYEDDDDYYEDEEGFPEEVEDAFMERRESRFANFLEDPWPKTAFILILIGFGIILPWPEAIWFTWLYHIIALYVLSILGVVAIVYSLKAWITSGTKIRFIGMLFIIISIVSLVVGFIDTIAWALTGYSFIPALQTPLVVLFIVVEVFLIYTLWIMRSQFMAPETED